MSVKMRHIDATAGDIHAELIRLRERLSPRGDIVSDSGRRKTIEVFGQPLSPRQVVQRICSEVQKDGLSAVLRYGKSLDSSPLTPDSLRVPAEDLVKAHSNADSEFLETIRRICQNIRQFQSALLSRDVTIRRKDDVWLRQRYVPLRRVGICVPGGAAAYPSTVLMTAVPAQTAGVEEIAVVAPPTDFGAYNPDLLATCHELGIQEVYRVGGAQGVAMLAYGVDDVAAVDKIVGPGNMFVALAKQHVFGDVDIDSIAGPSEVVVLADDSARADFIAADLLAQAEHAPGASILITWSENLVERVKEALQSQLSRLSRCELTTQSLADFGAFILVNDRDQACELTDWIAPEHLHIATGDAEQLVEKIHNAGATFLGDFSPVALGDYVAGPSHVLPTGGTARWASGLSANDFLRGSSVIHYGPVGMKEAAGDVRTMADKERLTAHRASIDIRCE